MAFHLISLHVGNSKSWSIRVNVLNELTWAEEVTNPLITSFWAISHTDESALENPLEKNATNISTQRIKSIE